jgi:hypothetical protein
MIRPYYISSDAGSEDTANTNNIDFSHIINIGFDHNENAL